MFTNIKATKFSKILDLSEMRNKKKIRVFPIEFFYFEKNFNLTSPGRNPYAGLGWLGWEKIAGPSWGGSAPDWSLSFSAVRALGSAGLHLQNVTISKRVPENLVWPESKRKTRNKT